MEQVIELEWNFSEDKRVWNSFVKLDNNDVTHQCVIACMANGNFQASISVEVSIIKQSERYYHEDSQFTLYTLPETNCLASAKNMCLCELEKVQHVYSNPHLYTNKLKEARTKLDNSPAKMVT